MKGLSLEEKAKAYDSMFERLKEMYNNNKTNVAARLIYERYFPELKESEDERIRKGIVKMIYDIAGGFPFEKHGIIKKEALAWLEKQREYKSIQNEEDEKISKALIYHYQGDGCLCTNEYRIDYKEIRAWLEKQGEHKDYYTKQELIDMG